MRLHAQVRRSDSRHFAREVLVLCPPVLRSGSGALLDYGRFDAVQQATAETAQGYGLPADSIRSELACTPSCTARGARVTATVVVSVGLPLMPTNAATVAQVRSSSTSLTPRYG